MADLYFPRHPVLRSGQFSNGVSLLSWRRNGDANGDANYGQILCVVNVWLCDLVIYKEVYRGRYHVDTGQIIKINIKLEI